MAEGGLCAVVVRPRCFEDHLSEFPARLLDSPCDEDILIKLTLFFSEWQCQLSSSLLLTAVEMEDIERAWPRDPTRQRVECLVEDGVATSPPSESVGGTCTWARPRGPDLSHIAKGNGLVIFAS